MIEVSRFGADHLRTLVAGIDRSELVDLHYQVVDGVLTSEPVRWQVPRWDPDGAGDHSVAVRVAFLEPVLDRGAVLLGALAGDEVAGVAVVEPVFEPETAWLTFLHVSSPYRRRGVASRLWDRAEEIAGTAGARSILVSSTESRSAVGFYLSRGCELASPPHPELFAKEPEDIHLVKWLD